jgi:hypothetical protein
VATRQTCLDEKLLAKRPSAGGKPTPAQAVVAAVAGALSPQLQDAWPQALPIVGGLLRQLGAQHAGMAVAVLERLDAMLTGASVGMEVRHTPVSRKTFFARVFANYMFLTFLVA